MSKERLFLIDGSALFYRSYFAFIRNPLINSKGENTSACYGFALYMMNIIYDIQPEYLGVVFDTKEPTFRHDMYAEYKATRDKMPDDMVTQIPRIVELVKAFDVPFLEMVGYEADDIIGTLATRAADNGIEAYMATADKDMMQLLSPMIKMYNMRPGKDAEIIDQKYLMDTLELRPEQVIDYLALMGDSSDNVPGVPKVGKKTAINLLKEFGTMENLYANLDKVTQKAVNASLTENRELADLSKKLVTIETNVPIDVDFESLKISPVDSEKLVPLFQDLEFKSLVARVQEGPSAVPVATTRRQYDPETQKYNLISTPEELKKLAADLEKLDFFVFDTETTGLNPFDSEVIGIAFSWEKDRGCYVLLDHPEGNLAAEQVVDALKPVFENPAIKKGAHNIKFDALMLRQHGINVAGIEFDTLIANNLVTSETRQNKLDTLTEKYFNYEMIPITDLIGPKGKNQKSMTDVPLEQITPYACEDADLTLQLKILLAEKLSESGTEELFKTVEMPLTEILIKVEENGVKLDTDFLNQMSEKFGKDILRLRSEIYELAGEEFNVNSTQQLGKILFDKLEIHKELKKRPPKRTATGQYSTTEAILLKYEKHPVVNKILQHRKLVKLKSTYIDALPQLVTKRTGRVHTSFSQTIAATGRLSSSDPNLQNIPIRGELGREIRKAFIPGSEDSVILSADYSQVELRMMAHMSEDEAMKEAFEQGEDFHSTTAAAIFDLSMDEVTPDHRRKAKAVNFGIIYGISRFGLASRLEISANEAEQIIASYFTRFRNVNQYMIDTIQFARENKYVKTVLGRVRNIPEIMDRNANIRQNAERIAINTTIQGSAADLIKLAMISIQNLLEEKQLQTKMILQVHDELVFEAPKSEIDIVKPLVITEMENAMKLKVPLKVDAGVGGNWLEAH